MEKARQDIRKYLLTVFGDKEFSDNDNIFEMGFISSLFAIELIMYIEKNFNVTLENNDLSIENFKSIDSMTQLINQKRSQKNVM
ncbi:acyl carrier protein [Salipaludibacillus agaradhaerens]|uniref:acyl carrier protein n=1 Tax=Salipaludibacillus agaradhaerens TaxID=76935 RepID=UPI002151E8D8|nr:phosphopantetheine-binding protein [Salipaludibacillus agaradhaerens]MCR6105807.1 acyl carrier protein [Salipaludibacillus agaradhaerens]MCR6117843.1 acyl carrier protein [Salipaludibacillus agaradhaerens]